MINLFSRASIVSALGVLTCVVSAESDDAVGETAFLSGTRQLTFEGKRAGEGYFSADGSRMIFQSERDAENPFYQIYLMDLDMGDVTRISPGIGKTTCSWIHPREEKVLFASTHGDPDARKKMKDELDFRSSGQTRRYSWDYDENYEIYEFDFLGRELRQLTHARGYDAEGSWSPGGEWIAFASNRGAYSTPLSDTDRELFEQDPAYMTDIYRMRSDGSGLERLTDVKGYDGGPFFNPDGSKICWRRFSENGATAEVYVMNADGTGQRPITRVGAMSWAPYWHSSADYLIFTTNTQGFANFELYLVDAEGKHEPVRVTYTDGFDGLPVFSPDGKSLAWTSNRTPNRTSQIFIAAWNDETAREALGLKEARPAEPTLEGAPSVTATAAAITAQDVRIHVEYLASRELQGRRTGEDGERKATAYVASIFEALGVAPAGTGGSYFQEFEFTAGVKLGAGNYLRVREGANETALETENDWRPLAYSANGTFDAAEVVFAGYGIKAPAAKGETEETTFEEYDSFVHLDVSGKWAMLLRYMPEDISPEFRQHLSAHSSLRYKAMTLRDLGAKGMLVVSGPNSAVDDQLVPMVFDGMLGGTSIAGVTISDAAAQRLLDFADKDLKTLQDELDKGDVAMGFAIPGATLSAAIDVVQEKQVGRNAIARLNAGPAPGGSAIVVGAHIDHLGVGAGSSSLMRSEDKDAIHYGADDNASGVAGLIEIAQYLADQKSQGRLDMRRDIIFGAWSGEELGRIGSDYYVNHYTTKQAFEPLRPELAAYLNMDMIGRLTKSLVLGGIGSSSIWPAEIEQRNAPIGLTITTQNDTYLPTDSTSFYLRGVPFLSAFTGVHEDYHTPRDTADKINYEGAANVAKFMALVARSLVTRADAPDYIEHEAEEQNTPRANLRAYLGSIPDYVEGDVKGVKLSGVTKGAPAEKAGLKAGDIITELAGRKIENIYDYTYAIEALKVGEEVNVVVMREGSRIETTVTPGSRE
ncbi:MAG: M28 family peptidase [Candidatus Hydrogenedentota bacterium]